MSAFVLVVALMVVGLTLLAMEIVILPGFGVPGIAGGAVVMIAVAVAYAFVSPAASAYALAAGIGTSGLMFWLLPQTRMAKRMVLTTAHTARAPDASLRELVGRQGLTVCTLRPSGTADFQGTTVDVVSEGQYIAAGSPVRVVLVEGARVVVTPADSLAV